MADFAADTEQHRYTDTQIVVLVALVVGIVVWEALAVGIVVLVALVVAIVVWVALAVGMVVLLAVVIVAMAVKLASATASVLGLAIVFGTESR